MYDINAILAEMLNETKPSAENINLLSSIFAEIQSAGSLPDMEEDGDSIATPRTVLKGRYRQKEKARRLEDICILDFETDPFDNTKPHIEVHPFLGVLYRDNHEPIVIWDDDVSNFIDKIVLQIEMMEGRYTIYAHNGGRFDYKFLVRKLRGEIRRKGNSIMKATIGEHELRDSLHILPAPLSSLEKDNFDYSKMHRDQRHKHRDEIIQYCINDCKYLLAFIKHFVKDHGFKISIGQAAFGQIKKLYPKIENLKKRQDQIFRQFFFGGRVEFFAGHIWEKGEFKYIDLNSAYPAVMTHSKHPIGKNWQTDYVITKDTWFIELKCFSKGAFVARIDGETRCPVGYGHFYTTIHEYKAAKELGLIWGEEIIETHNCALSTDFSHFVIPNYNGRRAMTARMKEIENEGEKNLEWDNLNKDQTIRKFLLNNGYGKFAQNPERYKENMQLDHGIIPEGEGWEDIRINPDYVEWERPNPSFRYNNVATGASITGAQRAVLMRALAKVKRPIYCDTDSIICEDIGDLEMDNTKLGAWKLEATLSEIIINGKKHYAYHDPKKKKDDGWTVRCKGAGGITLEQIKAVNQDTPQTIWQKGITLRNDGSQYYTHRTVKKTGQSERIRADGKLIGQSNSALEPDVSESVGT